MVGSAILGIGEVVGFLVSVIIGNRVGSVVRTTRVGAGLVGAVVAGGSIGTLAGLGIELTTVVLSLVAGVLLGAFVGTIVGVRVVLDAIGDERTAVSPDTQPESKKTSAQAAEYSRNGIRKTP